MSVRKDVVQNNVLKIIFIVLLVLHMCTSIIGTLFSTAESL